MQKESPPQDNKPKKALQSRKREELYLCGAVTCRKQYHTYAGFYNHCKKCHEGKFPAGSLVNNKVFQGPSKNRGRPRKVESNPSNESDRLLRATKSEADLLDMLVLLKVNDMALENVEDPSGQLAKAAEIVQKKELKGADGFLEEVHKINEFVSKRQPQVSEDPAESKDESSYSFINVLKLMTDQKNRQELGLRPMSRESLRQLVVVWLARVASVEVLVEAISFMIQDQSSESGGIGAVTEERGRDFLDRVDKFAKSSIKYVVRDK